MGTESLLESEDENGGEVSNSDINLLYDESESEMDTETCSVVIVSESVGTGSTQSGPVSSSANKEKELSETHPPVKHTPAPQVHIQAPPPLVSPVHAGNPHGTAAPDNNKARPSTYQNTASPPQIDYMLGREPRVTTMANIGNFVPVNPVTPAIGSYATTGGLVRVPVLDHNRRIVTSHSAKFPALSDTSKLNVYISSHCIHGLPNHIEQVVRSDLELEVLMSLVEHDLHSTQPNSKLSIIVVDFCIRKQKSDMWHKEKILEIMTLVQHHPAGNVIRFGMHFYNPDIVKSR